jgi:hypothetical protein
LALHQLAAWHRREKEKAFFFEKKKQKTFMSLGSCWRKVRDSYPKVFWFFFSKKNYFLPSYRAL